MTPPGEYLLAMDTSGDVCSVALLRSGQLVVEHAFQHAMHLSEHLLDVVDTVLHAAGITLSQVNVFAVGVGPGSFTGTRVGVMTVQTFAVVTGRPAHAVGSLEALASVYAGLHPTVVVPVLPCRTGVVFACPFAVEEAIPHPLAPVAACPLPDLADLVASLQSPQVLFCGSAVARYRQALSQMLQDRVATVCFGAPEFPSAGQVARIACLHRAAGRPADDPMHLAPLYIAPPPITLPRTPIPTQMPPV
ncbi:MAG: tRNA (adenosine(37)-N6)-threonylcarbamoyltransferase complex dimerization subunit type 1 TsaB [Chloroherpetonaceae bacterium]|nr:tRNA (adenosine(37)-N6)-threonylcarbamoyltransferase complex dimerization subunit type 1 TsaB [Chthonomonadaceae bacterium]MDW8208695.1 tRNA (adenosine(37)-N6)-threonylcarbamoyltransferase complex dimerization subunit type 1 TsaB [Chloroherpetonaceae bacterium]